MLGGRPGKSAPSNQVSFADALRTRTFVLLYVAELQSIMGDQFARVALAVLVYQRTGSAAATGAIFAATYLPAIVGSAALGHLADRLPRRPVMIVVELFRAAVLMAMAIPAVPLFAVVTLLVLSVFVGPLFSAAEVSYLATAMPRDVFRAANGLRMFGSQGAQVIGFAAGAPLVAGLGVHAVLALDAATFVVSAVLAVVAIAPGLPPSAESAPSSAIRTARDALWRNRRVRGLVLLSALAGFYVVPEGVAVPLAHQLHGSTAEAGVLLAALPLGSVIGVYVLVQRVSGSRRARAVAGMAACCGLPLVVSGLVQDLWVAAVCWVVAGALAAYQVEVLTQIVQGIPDAVRARSLGICNAILLGVQGLGVAAFGAVSDATRPSFAVGLAGGLGALSAVAIVTGILRAGGRRGADADGVDGTRLGEVRGGVRVGQGPGERLEGERIGVALRRDGSPDAGNPDQRGRHRRE